MNSPLPPLHRLFEVKRRLYGSQLEGYSLPPPNVTRRLELTYNRPARLEMGYIQVHARLKGRQDRFLEFSAEVLDPGGKRLARAQATHWIVEPDANANG